MWRLLALWLVWFVVITALLAGVCLLCYELVAPPSGFFAIRVGLAGAFVIGAIYGSGWALILFLPYAFGLWLWLKAAAFFGDTETTRLRIAVGMLVWSLPQAVLVGISVGAQPFLWAWLVVWLGLALPRLLLPSLRPGAFLSVQTKSQPSRIRS
jgi:hypothetical protein